MSLKLFAWGKISGEHPTPHAGLGERGGVGGGSINVFVV